MIAPNVYYGSVAQNYERSREVKAKWKAEQAAVDRFLTDGPVLDVPFGTGRFVPIYRAKGIEYIGVDISADMLEQARARHGNINARIGSIFDLTSDRRFATAICVRFLEWLPLDRAKHVIDRLRGLADTLILTITHGVEGQPEAYTYDFGKFLHAIDGLLIEDRCVTAQVRDMTSEIFKLRLARWSDVVEQFCHDYYADEAEHHIQRVADKFAAFFGLPAVSINRQSVTVRCEYWSGDKIGVCVDALADHRFITDDPPRTMTAPLTAVERDGIALIIDGRKRANRLMTRADHHHPVLVIRPA